MATQAQIQANRANAELSTGPRTPEGKARSSRNAVTHGLTAQAPLLPNEDPALYEAFQAEMLADLSPQSAPQLAFAHQIVLVAWKLHRIPALESRLLVQEAEQLAEDPAAATSLDIQVLAFCENEPNSPLERLQRLHNTLLRQFSRLMKDYRSEQKAQNQANPPPTPANDQGLMTNDSSSQNKANSPPCLLMPVHPAESTAATRQMHQNASKCISAPAALPAESRPSSLPVAPIAAG